jgi:hypothetical protein
LHSFHNAFAFGAGFGLYFQDLKGGTVRNHIIKTSLRFAATGGNAWWCERVRIRV